jgi:hypothetical protein
MKRIAFVIALTVSASAAMGQSYTGQDRSGWSQESVTGGRRGQYNNGTTWRTQSGGGVTSYLDSQGRNCWTQSGGGVTTTSCSQ